MAVEQLDSLIGLYRKQLGIRNLEFMSVSGLTHLIEVVELKVGMNAVIGKYKVSNFAHGGYAITHDNVV